jgi:hypothetical protein
MQTQEERNAYHRRWYAEHRDQQAGYRAKCKAEGKNHIKGRKMSNAEYQRQWSAKHRERLAAQAKAMYPFCRANPKYRATHIFHVCKNRAAKKGLPFEITREWIHERLIKGICEATGIPFILDEETGVWSPSIDRIDPAKGYTPDNCRLVIMAFNGAKHTGTDADVLRLAEAVLANRPRLNL